MLQYPSMKKKMTTLNQPVLWLTLLSLPILFLACKEKGPMEKAGESIDNAAEEMKDAVEKDGTAEKIGESIDDALKTE